MFRYGARKKLEAVIVATTEKDTRKNPNENWLITPDRGMYTIPSPIITGQMNDFATNE